MIRKLSWLVLLSACTSSAPADHSEPEIDVESYGPLLQWTPDQQLVGYRNFDRILATRTIAAGDFVLELPDVPRDLSGLSFEFDGEALSLESFVERNHVVGLLVLKDGAIALERYRKGNGPDTRWVSFSVAKSVVSLLYGAAIKDGYITDLDESVTAYLPRLRGTSYEGVSIRDALQMASGVEWSEDYGDPSSDVRRLSNFTSLTLLDYLGERPRVAAPGERFNYNSGETHLLASVLRSAIGSNLSTYLSSKMWRPFGMEADANWLLWGPDGPEDGGCCISATLRDYGRIGLFVTRGGALPDGDTVLPAGWMEQSTSPSPSSEGYGFLWWLIGDQAYAALGVFGQMIFIDPAEDLVVVTHSVWPDATAGFPRSFAFAAAVRDALRE